METVNIIMPCFNAAGFLPKSIEAIINQSYRDWKLWFVDDCSTDSSLDIAVTYAKLNPKINICINAFFHGPSAARNCALSLFNKEKTGYTAFCDSDDFWYVTHLEDSLEMLDYLNVDVVYSDVDLRFENGSVAIPYGIKQPPFDPPIYISSAVMKTNCINTMFDTRVDGREDWVFWAGLFYAGYKFQYIAKKLTQYTVKNNGMAASWNSEKDKIFNEEMLRLKMRTHG